MRLTTTQKGVLYLLLNDDTSMLGTFRPSTVNILVKKGFVESFVPEARTWAACQNGRVRYYRLTNEGKKFANNLFGQESKMGAMS